MNTILQTSVFREWLAELRDAKVKAAILVRIDRAALGSFGDCAPVGQGVSEMRIHVGPGYRVYYGRRGKTVYLLLCGGDKRSEKADIRRAQALAKTV